MILNLHPPACILIQNRHRHTVYKYMYASFQQKHAPKKGTRPLEKIKGINPSSMPTCGTVLLNKLLCTHYVAHLLKKAIVPVTCIPRAEDRGWQLNESTLSINWYDGEQLCQNIANIYYHSWGWSRQWWWHDKLIPVMIRMMMMNQHTWTITQVWDQAVRSI